MFNDAFLTHSCISRKQIPPRHITSFCRSCHHTDIMFTLKWMNFLLLGQTDISQIFLKWLLTGSGYWCGMGVQLKVEQLQSMHEVHLQHQKRKRLESHTYFFSEFIWSCLEIGLPNILKFKLQLSLAAHLLLRHLLGARTFPQILQLFSSPLLHLLSFGVPFSLMKNKIAGPFLFLPTALLRISRICVRIQHRRVKLACFSKCTLMWL